MGKGRKRRGRPPRAGVSSPIKITFRATSAEQVAWQEAAGNQSLSDWVRACCKEELKRRAARILRKTGVTA